MAVATKSRRAKRPQGRPLPPAPLVNDFWCMEDPELDDRGKVLKGGMWPHQRKWWELENFIKVLVAGYGAGKTLVGGKWAIAAALENAPAPIAVVSPSFPLARHTTIKTIRDLLYGKKTLYGPHWWMKENKSSHEFTFSYHGRKAQIIVYSGEHPEALVGPNLGGVWIDEPFLQDVQVFKQMVARVRHPDAKKPAIVLTGCVTRDTLILPKKGMCTIGAVDPGVMPKKYGVVNIPLYGIRRKVHLATQFFNNGMAETRKVFVECGYELEATPDHPVLVMGVDGVPCWKPVGELSVGESVAIGRGMEVWGGVDPLVGIEKALIKVRNRKNKHTLPPNLRMTEDLAYFLGLWLAEGSHERGRVTITCGDNAVATLAKTGVLGVPFVIGKTRKDQCRANSLELETLMKYVGMPMVKAPQKYIPEWVFKGRREWALAFLAGMWDGDGCVCADGSAIRYSTTSERMARELQCLLLNLGIVSSRRQYIGSPSKLVKVWSISYGVAVHSNNAALLAKVLPLRIERKRKEFKNYTKGRDSDAVPNQGALIKRAWDARDVRRWRKGTSRLEPNKIVECAGKYEGVAYSTIADFVSRWHANETTHPEPIRLLEENVFDHYYWAKVRSIEMGCAETVDFVVPDTHSFWSNGFISHNTPEQLNWGYDLCMGQGEMAEEEQWRDLGMVQAATYDNKALDPKYTARLKGTFSGKAAEAYVDGSFTNLSTGQVYYAFSGLAYKGPPEGNNVKDLPIPEDAVLGCGMDFNVNPFAFVVFWRKGEHVHVIDEVELLNADTQYAASVLRERYVDEGRLTKQVLTTIYPDASGNFRSTKSPRGKTDFDYLREAGFTIDAPHANGLVRDRENVVNGKLRPAEGPVTITVQPRCHKLIKYLSLYNHEDKATEAQKAMSHLIDAFGYPIVRLFPVDRTRVRRLTGM